MPVSFKMRGQDKVEAFLKRVPYGAKQVVLPAVSEYLLGDDAHGLRHYPPPQGQKYVRTYTLKAGWKVVADTYRQRIINEVSYAPYVPPRWAHYGWREWAAVIESNMAGALRSANARLKEWLKAQGA